MVAEFTAKTTNSELAIYFLLLMSCSINKHKFYILFTCKNFCENFVFQFNMEKSFPGSGVGGDGVPWPPFSTALIYTYIHIDAYIHITTKIIKVQNMKTKDINNKCR